MLKHSYLSPSKKRTKSQSSENSEIDDDRGICCNSTTTIATISTLKSCQSDDDDIKISSARPLRTKVSRRRPPSGAENAVRRWNSFHSTRGECHPNKFRRDRKSISPSIDLGRRSIIGGGSSTRSWELRRGKSLAEKSSLGASSLAAAKEHRAASICFGKRNGGSVRRPSECFVLETSEMIVIDYPEVSSLSNPSTIPSINSTAYHQRSSSLANSGQQSQLTAAGIKTSNRGGSYRGPLPYRHSVGNNTAQSPNTIGLINNMDHHNIRHAIQSGVNIVCDDSNFGGNRPDLYQKCNRGSHSSDTSSAYSGSDTMTSVHSSSLDADEVDLSGLVESVVDSDEEDLAESMDSLAVRDTVRECLEKDPSDRTEDDIETLLDFTKNLKAFTNVTLAVRRALCSVMVFAVVEKAGTMVMNDGEELDSWSVLINGHVEIEQSTGEKEELQVGDSFGILPTMDKLYHRGVMRTKCHDCQFVCITQTDYYRIQHQGEENTMKHEEDGRVVMVTELRHGAMEGGTRRGHIVIRGTSERLLQQLIEEDSMTDPTYVEDFLLTHRTFIDSAQKVLNQLLTWFDIEDASTLHTTATPSEIRERVTRVVLLWLNNHFTDFETDPQMMESLETFESGLEKQSMVDHLRLFYLACKTKARTRTVTLTRSSRDEDLNFDIVGGYEKGYGYRIFISKVNKNSKPEDVGLKRGDQILEVNGQTFGHFSCPRALELMTSTTHLSITVKSNLLAFKEVLHNPDNGSPLPRQCRRKVTADISKLQTHDPRARLSSVDILSTSSSSSTSSHDQTDCAILISTQAPTQPHSNTKTTASKKEGSLSSLSSSSSTNSHKGGFMTLGPKRRLQRALIKMNLLPKNAAALLYNDGYGHSDDNQTTSSADLSTNQSKTTGSSNNNNNSANTSSLYQSHSNPDLTTLYYEDLRASDYPEHVLKVYKPDQTCKYLLVHKETTAHEVVMLSLQEFGIHDPSSNFSLCEVSVGEGGMIKQRRLPEQLQNLAERIGLSSRYYLKTNGITETLVPDDMAPELIRESAVHFLQLNANELAIQLTFQDFAIFRQIEPTEYLDDLFELKSKYGIPMLRQFAELVNREMFWVVTEVCSEHNMVRRMKIIKQFVKIARHCKECKNFNSMFAIISGLGHVAVSRLRLTWEKLPSKYQKLFCDLQDLMDPSRNMSKYRQLVLTELGEQHPIIPFYPVVKKDLTFIHLGNDTYVDNLINFEKLRMIAKEVRSLTHMCSTAYDLLTLLELKGQPPSSAMVALNQMSVSSNPHSQHNSQATVKRRKKSTAAPNPKKMFEEAQMVRRVKAYLNNMKVITDEDALHVLSLECEPSGGSAPNTVIIRKRHPSPTLSTTSSTSSTSEGKKGSLAGPKFGAASPQAVKKILSLSEPSKTRPHQPRHPGITGGPVLPHHHGLHHPLHHSSVSPSPSPGAHRRMGSSSSAGSMTYSTHGYSQSGGRAVHERSHSDTPTPLPSVDLSVESSSVTSLSNLPLRKNITSGSVTSSDSGHGSCIQADTHSNCSESGIYHVASSIVHNLPSPILQQRRHSTMHGPTYLGLFPNTLSQMVMLTSPTSSTTHTVQDTLIMPTTHHPSSASTSSSSSSSFAGSSISLSAQQSPNNMHGRQTFPSSTTQIMPVTSPLGGGTVGPSGIGHTAFVPTSIYLPSSRPNGHGLMAPPQNSKVPRQPPAYSVAAQMARLHRIGRAHSHEGVTLPNTEYFFTEPREEDDDEDAQVSAV